MSDHSAWSVSEPRNITIQQSVERVRVRVVSGRVNVVGTPDAHARLEVTALDGPPLEVSVDSGTLTVTHGGLPWEDFLSLFDREGWQRHAEITLAVPAHADLRLGVVTADTVVSGLTGRTQVRGVKAATTLVGLTGSVRADTVSGDVEVQGLAGSLRFHSVSGGLTLMEGQSATVQADSVSGALVCDLTTADRGTDLALVTVSGPIATRLPGDSDVTVDASSTSGATSSAFEELTATGPEGTCPGRRVAGHLGEGGGHLRLRSVSGAVAVLRHPEEQREADLITLAKDV